MAVTTTTVMILLAASAAASAYGSHRQGQAAKKQAEGQARVSEEQAARARVVAGQQEEDFRRRQKAAAARVRAAAGGRGIDPSKGSSLLSAEDFAAETELMSLRIREGGLVTATRLEQQADLTRRAGQAAATAGTIEAGASLLSGAGRSARILKG